MKKSLAARILVIAIAIVMVLGIVVFSLSGLFA